MGFIMLLFGGLTYSQSESPNNPTEIEIQALHALDVQGAMGFDEAMASFQNGELTITQLEGNRFRVERIGGTGIIILEITA